jgi:caspase domain-containing protein
MFAALMVVAAPTPVGAQPASEVSRLYDGSYALLIGVSQYDARKWAPLSRIPGEIDRLSAVLVSHGFRVTPVTGRADARAVKGAIEKFINDYGYQPKARLVVFFAGHGYTRRDGQMGYIVPSDAPHPTDDERGFLRTAIAMQQFDTWARTVEARHVMFIFDSCFSGSIFLTRGSAARDPRPLSRILAEPARLFLTAGGSTDTVPAESVFTPLLVRGLQGEADTNRDGLITGTELGLWVQQESIAFDSNQTPLFGKVRNPDLERGDIVFAGHPTVSPPAVTPPPPPAPAPNARPMRAPFVGTFAARGWVDDDGTTREWTLTVTDTGIDVLAREKRAARDTSSRSSGEYIDTKATCEWLDRPEPVFLCSRLPGRKRIPHADPTMEQQINMMLFMFAPGPGPDTILVREPRDGKIHVTEFTRRR